MTRDNLKDDLKKQSAEAALKYVEQDAIIGIGTGSTVNFFIDALADMKHLIEGTVASSEASTERLKKHGIPVYDINAVNDIAVYIDGADQINEHFYMIKGGGGAHTREKIVATTAQKFVCIADESKYVDILGETFPVAVEVLPMARGLVAREIIKLHADPIYREGFITDNGNVILDVYNLNLVDPVQIEKIINNIVGVVENGIFARRPANILLLAGKDGVKTKIRP